MTVRVGWSSVNYKDALAVSPKGRVAKTYPLVPGIDLAGEVIESDAGGDLAPGAIVLAHGHEIGVGQHGGYAEIARVPADWVDPAARRPERARRHGARHRRVHRGAVGRRASRSTGCRPRAPAARCSSSARRAASARSRSGSSPRAATRSTPRRARPTRPSSCAGSARREVLSREETSAESDRPMEKQRWAAVVDPVGGAATAYALRTTRYGGAVALSGLTGGTDLATTVFPFILRSVSLLGIDSVETPGGRPARGLGAPRDRPAAEGPRGPDHARDRARRPRPVPRRGAGREGARADGRAGRRLRSAAVGRRLSGARRCGRHGGGRGRVPRGPRRGCSGRRRRTSAWRAGRRAGRSRRRRSPPRRRAGRRSRSPHVGSTIAAPPSPKTVLALGQRDREVVRERGRGDVLRDRDDERAGLDRDVAHRSRASRRCRRRSGRPRSAARCR